MIIARQTYRLSFALLVCLFLLTAARLSAQQKTVALIRADKNEMTRNLAQALETSLEDSFRLADPELVEQVIDVSAKKNLFNLSLEEARNIGIGIGCDFYVVLRSEDLRRSSFRKNAYYEAYAVVFLVNARTGRLAAWKHLSAEADEAAQADKNLALSFGEYIREIPEALRKNAEDKTVFDTSLYEIDENNERDLRTPLPFRRFSPTSTSLAQYLRIEAVVDIEAAIDEKGYITQTRIVRWAGFGLDEEVTETVRKMNFRPAVIGGKAIPARFLLRYNFRVPVENKHSL
jgi:TonB family protein